MSDEPEFDEKTLEAAERRAAELGFASVEDYVRALLERDMQLGSGPEAIEAHRKMRALVEAGQGDRSAN